ncbi:MAG: TIGR03986 family type III CRISPR-associated RAMP protein [Egibacteraceae bacterium]
MPRVTVVRLDEQGGQVWCRVQEADGEMYRVPHDDDHVGPYPARVYQTGTVEDGMVLLDDTRAVPCRVVGRTGNDRRGWKAKMREEATGEEFTLTMEQIGVSLHTDIKLLPGLGWTFLLIDRAAVPAGHWDLDGGVAGALEEARAESAREREQEQQAKRHREAVRKVRNRTDEDWQRRFVNPYTFVPFPRGLDDASVRREPAGHDRLGVGRLSGWLVVRLRARSPLLVRGEQEAGSPGRFPTRAGEDGSPVPMIPGSSLKGALRSLHEILAGGCLRVLDEGFVPAYRDPAQARPEGSTWRLARVDQVDDDGRPTALTLCVRKEVWAKAVDLHPYVGGASGLRTGATVDVDEALAEDIGIREVVPADALGEGGGWVVLVTDHKARREEYRDGKPHSKPHPDYYCALGKLGDQTIGLADGAWETYLREVDGADDVRRADHGQEVCLDVRFRNQPIGRRNAASRMLDQGEVVWVELGPAMTQACRLTLSVLWRSAGEGPLGERVPEVLLPCSRPGHLCPSCRVFGSVAPGVDHDREGAEHTGYRGHVRFGDALAGECTLRTLDLAPMGSPHPGAGQFYLDHKGQKTGDREDRPARRWGAKQDAPELRPVRGRKLYWHGDPEQQKRAVGQGRHLRRKDQRDWNQKVQVAGTGSTFTARVVFESLCPAEVGGLLAAISPDLVLTTHAPEGFAEPPEILGRIGGGKPLGLGSVKAEIVELHLHDAASRYLGAKNDQPSRAELLTAFVESVPEAVKATWPDLAAALNAEHVDPRWIWYPPGAEWAQVGKRAFDDGFEFWKQTDGAFIHELVTLPPPRAADQALDILTKGGLKGGNGA